MVQADPETLHDSYEQESLPIVLHVLTRLNVLSTIKPIFAHIAVPQADILQAVGFKFRPVHGYRQRL